MAQCQKVESINWLNTGILIIPFITWCLICAIFLLNQSPMLEKTIMKPKETVQKVKTPHDDLNRL